MGNGNPKIGIAQAEARGATEETIKIGEMRGQLDASGDYPVGMVSGGLDAPIANSDRTVGDLERRAVAALRGITRRDPLLSRFMTIDLGPDTGPLPDDGKKDPSTLH